MVILLSPSGKILISVFRYFALSFLAIFFARLSEALPPITVNFVNKIVNEKLFLSLNDSYQYRNYENIKN